MSDPVLVVRTTPDYVLKLEETCPGASLFLLDSPFRGDAFLRDLDEAVLLFAPLEDGS